MDSDLVLFIVIVVLLLFSTVVIIKNFLKDDKDKDRHDDDGFI